MRLAITGQLLASPPERGEVSARIAIHLAQRLRSTLEHYRCAVDAALVLASSDDDIPF